VEPRERLRERTSSKQFPEPKPAYSTVSTIVRILEKKEFVGSQGVRQDAPVFSVWCLKEAYTKHTANRLVDNYFDGSFKNLVSFFVRDNEMTVKEMDQLMQVIESRKQQQ
jgi:BlaI family transcriptional regulator, penicillinase repressor